SAGLAYPEARAALAAARRDGRLSGLGYRRAKAGFEDLWRQVWIIEFDARVAHDAGEVAERFALRGYDAVHLAAAMMIGEPGLVWVTWVTDLGPPAIRLPRASPPDPLRRGLSR